jgi:hypothetical protein
MPRLSIENVLKSYETIAKERRALEKKEQVLVPALDRLAGKLGCKLMRLNSTGPGRPRKARRLGRPPLRVRMKRRDPGRPPKTASS